jgi:hypothetical protein
LGLHARPFGLRGRGIYVPLLTKATLIGGLFPMASPMINQAELKVAAVIGALLGIVTGYLVGGEWLIMLIWALIGAVVVSGMVYCLRAFR